MKNNKDSILILNDITKMSNESFDAIYHLIELIFNRIYQLPYNITKDDLLELFNPAGFFDYPSKFE